MPTFRFTIERPMRFQLDLDVATRMDALQIIHDVAMRYDSENESKTTIIAITEIQQTNVHDSVD
jgi:hypothetical protein